MTDAVLIAAISGATTILSALLTAVIAKLNGVNRRVEVVGENVDGHLTKLMTESTALKGEIRRLAPVGAEATPPPGSGAPVMLNPDTGTITQTQPIPPPLESAE